MGVNTMAYLPPHVRVNDVTKVLAALMGCRVYVLDLGQGGYAAWCDEAHVESTTVPEMVRITVKAPHGEEFNATFHFEEHNARDRKRIDGTRILMTDRSQRNVEVLSALVKFFGGQLDANDCDTIDIDLDVPVSSATWAHSWSPSDGQEWADLQDAIIAVKPVGKSERAD